jgi:NADH-quinone oxidoreductase subunit J
MPTLCPMRSDRGVKRKRHEPHPLASARGSDRRLCLLLIVCIATLLGSADVTVGATSLTDAAQSTNAAAPGGLLEVILFNAVAGGVVLSALGVCIAKNIVRMAVWLFVGLGSVAMLYFLLAANFLGAIQLIVYAGGTLVLLVFGVMLTSKSPWVRFDPPKIEMALAAIVCTVLAVTLCTVLAKTAWSNVERIVPGATVASLGQRLLTTYLVPFEVAGVLLMIVMVGAAYLARQEE